MRRVKSRLEHFRLATTVVLAIGMFSVATVRLRSPEPGYRTRMIAALKSLYSAQVAFAASCGRDAYASSLAQLDDASFVDSAGAVFSDLETELKAIAEGDSDKIDCRGRRTTRAFYATAAVRRRWPGPTFAVDTDGVIWESANSVPPSPPFGPPSKRLQ